jgi:hypothetical protein
MGLRRCIRRGKTVVDRPQDGLGVCFADAFRGNPRAAAQKIHVRPQRVKMLYEELVVRGAGLRGVEVVVQEQRGLAVAGIERAPALLDGFANDREIGRPVCRENDLFSRYTGEKHADAADEATNLSVLARC